MPSYTPLATVYASDEDLCIRNEGDFTVLVPKAQKRASGADGSLAAGLWTLTSASVNFANQSVLPGMVVAVSIPVGTTAARPGEKSELFAVDTVSGMVLTLRRMGDAAGVGQPPSAVVVPSGVAFLIQTFTPQIEDVSYQLNRTFGVDPLIPGRTPSQFYDIREVNQVCVLMTLERQCRAQARQPGEGNKDALWEKAKNYAEELTEVLDRLALHWTAASGWGITQPTPATTRFSTKIVR